mmetsp:Transcript_98950/g.317282  ORF Transcript_98950/g.317282 Transcript_98950/m.317282 type:complete len:110 (-) Transcript_98950:272-601(-)
MSFSTSMLKTFYDEVNADGKVFEVVACSMDRDDAGFTGIPPTLHGSVPADTPWLAIPHEAPERDATLKKYSPPGVPTLTITKENGEVIELEGGAMISNGKAAFEQWRDT